MLAIVSMICGTVVMVTFIKPVAGAYSQPTSSYADHDDARR